MIMSQCWPHARVQAFAVHLEAYAWLQIIPGTPSAFSLWPTVQGTIDRAVLRLLVCRHRNAAIWWGAAPVPALQLGMRKPLSVCRAASLMTSLPHEHKPHPQTTGSSHCCLRYIRSAQQNHQDSSSRQLEQSLCWNLWHVPLR